MVRPCPTSFLLTCIVKCGKSESIFDQNSHIRSTCSNQLFIYKLNLEIVAVRQHVSTEWTRTAERVKFAFRI